MIFPIDISGPNVRNQMGIEVDKIRVQVKISMRQTMKMFMFFFSRENKYFFLIQIFQNDYLLLDRFFLIKKG